MELICKTKNYSKSYLKLLITGLFFLMIFLNVNPIVAKANEEGLYFDEDGSVIPKATEMGVSVDNMTAVNNYCRQVYLVNSNQTR